ncbi:MAG: hypothetical protein QM632_01640 [Micrococcaceae bacterium]
MAKFFTLVILALVVSISIFGMYSGWNKKLSKFKEENLEPTPVPSKTDTELDENKDLGELLNSYDGIYIATVHAQQPLERITAHHLGLKNRCTLAIYKNAIVFEKEPQDILIPMKGIRSVSLTEGMIGKFIGKDKVLTIGWRLGDIDVETGFSVEPGRTGQQENIIEIQQLIQAQLV